MKAIGIYYVVVEVPSGLPEEAVRDYVLTETDNCISSGSPGTAVISDENFYEFMSLIV